MLSLLVALIAWVTDLAPFKPLKSILIFAYCCFLKPLGKCNNQQERLDAFYKAQATGELTRNCPLHLLTTGKCMMQRVIGY